MDKRVYLVTLIARDMATGKEYNEQGWAICPVCKNIIGDGNFCRYCGQRLLEEDVSEQG